MEKIYEITLKLSSTSGNLPLFKVVQGDKSTRKIRATILNDDGTAYTPDDDITAEYWSRKPDGSGTSHSSGITIEDNIITVTLTGQDTAAAGTVYAAITLKKGTSQILTIMPFWFRVESFPIGQDVESISQYHILEDAADNANAAADNANAAADNANTAATHGPYIDPDTLYWYVWDEVHQVYVNTYVIATGAADGAVLYVQQTLAPTMQAQARANISAAAEVKQKLLADVIPGTTQEYTFSGEELTRILHRSGNTTIRTDAFVYAAGTITETRTLNTGESLTILTDLTTLATTVTYTE